MKDTDKYILLMEDKKFRSRFDVITHQFLCKKLEEWIDEKFIGNDLRNVIIDHELKKIFKVTYLQDYDKEILERMNMDKE